MADRQKLDDKGMMMAETNSKSGGHGLIWANLLHLGYNMWLDNDHPDNTAPNIVAQPYLRCDQSLWDDLVKRMADAGMNMLVVDLGEGVRYESHPELGVKGSWSPSRLRDELAKIRAQGIEVIPKLNFSACHDVWMGPYARMVSTEPYYKVCADLIAEVSELFDTPRYFHLGMDEETFSHQRHQEYIVIRQSGLWWRDLNFYAEHVEKAGVRPWIWSDYVWHHPEDFYANMPKSILQSNWYYGAKFADFAPDDLCETYVGAYVDLEAHGYDQIPTGSNWSFDTNMEDTVSFCRKHIAPERLLGFMTAPWKPSLEQDRAHHERAIDQVKRAIEAG